MRRQSSSRQQTCKTSRSLIVGWSENWHPSNSGGPTSEIGVDTGAMSISLEGTLFRYISFVLNHWAYICVRLDTSGYGDLGLRLGLWFWRKRMRPKHRLIV